MLVRIILVIAFVCVVKSELEVSDELQVCESARIQPQHIVGLFARLNTILQAPRPDRASLGRLLCVVSAHFASVEAVAEGEEDDIAMLPQLSESQTLDAARLDLKKVGMCVHSQTKRLGSFFSASERGQRLCYRLWQLRLDADRLTQASHVSSDSLLPPQQQESASHNNDERGEGQEQEGVNHSADQLLSSSDISKCLRLFLPEENLKELYFALLRASRRRDAREVATLTCIAVSKTSKHSEHRNSQDFNIRPTHGSGIDIYGRFAALEECLKQTDEPLVDENGSMRDQKVRGQVLCRHMWRLRMEHAKQQLRSRTKGTKKMSSSSSSSTVYVLDTNSTQVARFDDMWRLAPDILTIFVPLFMLQVLLCTFYTTCTRNKEQEKQEPTVEEQKEETEETRAVETDLEEQLQKAQAIVKKLKEDCAKAEQEVQRLEEAIIERKALCTGDDNHSPKQIHVTRTQDENNRSDD